MKPLVFCLLTLCCFGLVSTTWTDVQKRKLQEVLIEIRKVQKTSQQEVQMVKTPPKNIDDCCSLSALTCFRENLKNNFKIKDKLYKNLKSSLTISGLNFCGNRNATSSCTDCASHPKETTKEFFNRLESLIQKGLTRLSMK